jgi:molybdopterin synthase catalytic subunit
MFKTSLGHVVPGERVAIQVGVHKKGSIFLSDLIESMKDEEDLSKTGAIVSFVGVVRGENLDGEEVQKLEVEAYEEKADEVLADICEELENKDGIVNVQIHHLLGEFSVGEELVYVLVAGGHRGDVFPVLEEAVERFKKEAPIFKKEYIITQKDEKRSYWVAEHKKES